MAGHGIDAIGVVLPQGFDQVFIGGGFVAKAFAAAVDKYRAGHGFAGNQSQYRTVRKFDRGRPPGAVHKGQIGAHVLSQRNGIADITGRIAAEGFACRQLAVALPEGDVLAHAAAGHQYAAAGL